MQRPALPSQLAYVPLYVPNVDVRSGYIVTLATSNRGVLVTLKVSHRNQNRWSWPSGIRHDLARLKSRLK